MELSGNEKKHLLLPSDFQGLANQMEAQRKKRVVLESFFVLFRIGSFFSTTTLRSVMRSFFFFPLFLLSVSLFATDNSIDDGLYNGNSPIRPYATQEGVPTSVVNGCVNIITGDYFDAPTDLVIPGANPITFQRIYTSSNMSEGSLHHCWNHNHNGQLELGKTTRHYGANVTLGSGTSLYKSRNSKEDLGLNLDRMKGLTNCASGVISGKTNLVNNKVKYNRNQKNCELKTGNGLQYHFSAIPTSSELAYTKYGLDKIAQPSGNSVKYLYNKKRELQRVENWNRDTRTGHFQIKKIDENSKKPKIHLIASTGLRCTYYFQRHRININADSTYRAFFLEGIRAADGSFSSYEYEKFGKPSNSKNFKITRKNEPYRFQEIDYYDTKSNYVLQHRIKIKETDDPLWGRVKELRAPVGPDNTPIVTHTFVYDLHKKHDSSVSVYDAYKQLTKYYYSTEDRLTKIDNYSNGVVYRTEYLNWGENEQESFLMTHSLQDGERKTQFVRSYQYDDYGNVLESTFTGNLTGQDEAPFDAYKKRYTYSDDGLNLVLSEEDDKKTITYTYKENTDLVTSKLVLVDQEIQFWRFFQGKTSILFWLNVSL